MAGFELSPFTLRLPVDPPPSATQVYGARYDYYMKNFGLPGHEGVDFAKPRGALVYAARAGTVKLVAPANGVHPYGNQVRITHQHGADMYETIYAHLSAFAGGLREGQEVAAGQVIGYIGNTGNSDGNHLHLTLKKNGIIVDPTPYLE